MINLFIQTKIRQENAQRRLLFEFESRYEEKLAEAHVWRRTTPLCFVDAVDYLIGQERLLIKVAFHHSSESP